MAPETGSEQRCGIGARLRAGRERAGMSALQAAERLHLDPWMIEALEDEQFNSFGAPVYVRGYLRNYASLIGEPAAELQTMFEASRHTTLPDLSRAPRVPEQINSGRARKIGVFAAVTAALACAVWWVLTRGPR